MGREQPIGLCQFCRLILCRYGYFLTMALDNVQPTGPAPAELLSLGWLVAVLLGHGLLRRRHAG